MKLARFLHQGQPALGVVVDQNIVAIDAASSMIELITRWDDLRDTVASQVAAQADHGVPLSEVTLLAPVDRPGKIWAIGLNYADHIEESKMATPERQVWFTKAQTSINGPFDPIHIARGTATPDYEVELVAVIGKRGKHIAREDAAAHVFGYCVGNDVTERLWQHSGPQWSLGKSFDTHAPIGPWLTTADDVADPHDLALRCFVNGEKRQDSNTRHLVFDIWDQIAHLSQAMTLEPGDLIFTGTPGGVGAAMDPRRFLQPGDVVRCEVDGLGAIEGTMVPEPG